MTERFQSGRRVGAWTHLNKEDTEGAELGGEDAEFS